MKVERIRPTNLTVLVTLIFSALAISVDWATVLLNDPPDRAAIFHGKWFSTPGKVTTWPS